MMKTKHSFLAYTIIAFLLIFGATANTAYAASYIGGTATQDTGAPIAGITVQVEKSGSVIASATTNASGNYTVEVSVTGFMRVRPVSNDHDFQPVSTLLYLYANQTRTNINFVGTFIGAEPATIMGTITEDTGAPLAGITLQVEQNSNVIATTTTDANGDYEVAVDATGDVDVIPVSNAYAFNRKTQNCTLPRINSFRISTLSVRILSLTRRPKSKAMHQTRVPIYPFQERR